MSTTPNLGLPLFDDMFAVAPIENAFNGISNSLDTWGGTFIAQHGNTDYAWTNQAARLAQTGMVKGSTGIQLDTYQRYSYNASSIWQVVGGSLPYGMVRRTTGGLGVGNTAYVNMSANSAWSTAVNGELQGAMTYTNGFVVPIAGVYDVEWSLLFVSPTVGAVVGVGVNVSTVTDSSILHALSGMALGGGALAGNGSAKIRLNASDVLTLWGYGNGASVTTSAVAGAGSHFAAKYVGP